MEQEFHHWLKTRNAAPKSAAASILLGIGDDAAIVRGSTDSLVVATDTIAEGTHFELEKHSLSLIGRKSLAVNLSDLAAMAARPVAAVLTFLLPKQFDLDHAKQIYLGIEQLANEFELTIVGGDTNTWNGPLVVGATVLGRIDPGHAPWRMDGVNPGDGIVVSGSFGGSIHGHHLTFTPRLKLAHYLAENYAIDAATDVSDSLSLDLDGMARSSGLGIDLNPNAIPISDAVRDVSPTQALQHALTDGEDFELILAVNPLRVQNLLNDPNVPGILTLIGTATDVHTGLRTKQADGSWTRLTPRGYIH